MNNWISVKDRMPEFGNQMVLTYESRRGIIGVGYFGALGREVGWWNHCGCPANHITHWMPLPEPPKEESSCSKTE